MFRRVLAGQGQHGLGIFHIMEDKGGQGLPGRLFPETGAQFGCLGGTQGGSGLAAKGPQQVKVIFAIVPAGKLFPQANDSGKMVGRCHGKEQAEPVVTEELSAALCRLQPFFILVGLKEVKVRVVL